MIPIKTEKEIEKMRAAGEMAGRILTQLADNLAPGVTTGEIDQLAARLMADAGVRSAFLGYQGHTPYPGNICISINEEIVHGIGGLRKIRYGDLVKLDVGVIMDGWIGDTAASIPVGEVSPEVEQLALTTERILNDALKLALPGRRLGDMCAYIEQEAIKAGYSVVREFVGHGVGRKLHEEPQIPNYGKKGSGPKLKPGMTLAVEPMINLGRSDVRVLPDHWTVVTADGSASAHFEHTILITKDVPEILTWPRKTLLN